jgi:hypothetical protein
MESFELPPFLSSLKINSAPAAWGDDHESSRIERSDFSMAIPSDVFNARLCWS